MLLEAPLPWEVSGTLSGLKPASIHSNLWPTTIRNPSAPLSEARRKQLLRELSGKSLRSENGSKDVVINQNLILISFQPNYVTNLMGLGASVIDMDGRYARTCLDV